eukprot:gene42094-33867_t
MLVTLPSAADRAKLVAAGRCAAELPDGRRLRTMLPPQQLLPLSCRTERGWAQGGAAAELPPDTPLRAALGWCEHTPHTVCGV